jgi:hypothetical protein
MLRRLNAINDQTRLANGASDLAGQMQMWN